MPADDGMAFLRYVIDKDEESLLFQRWVVSAQFEMSFDEFKNKLKPKPLKDDEEILQDVESILRNLEVENGII